MNRNQITLIAFCLLLGIAIFVFGKKTVLVQDLDAPVMDMRGMTTVDLLSISKSKLNAEEQEKLLPIEHALDTVQLSGQQIALHRSLAAFWETKNDWAAAAVHYEAIAQLEDQAVPYMLSGSRYQSAAEMAVDTLLRNFLFAKAMDNMEKATQLDPEDLDMKADLANLIVLSTEQPMRGIQQLLDIVKQSPQHLKANLHLAQLAIRSGQHDKAVERFSNLIVWYPAFADAYLGLGEAYYSQGQTDLAIQTLEQYKGLVRDEMIIGQVDAFIKQIKSSTP